MMLDEDYDTVAGGVAESEIPAEFVRKAIATAFGEDADYIAPPPLATAQQQKQQQQQQQQQRNFLVEFSSAPTNTSEGYFLYFGNSPVITL